MNKPLVEMFLYNAWANRELYRVCRSLTDKQLDVRVQGISGSVRELLSTSPVGSRPSSCEQKAASTKANWIERASGQDLRASSPS